MLLASGMGSDRRTSHRSWGWYQFGRAGNRDEERDMLRSVCANNHRGLDNRAMFECCGLVGVIGSFRLVDVALSSKVPPQTLTATWNNNPLFFSSISLTIHP